MENNFTETYDFSSLQRNKQRRLLRRLKKAINNMSVTTLLEETKTGVTIGFKNQEQQEYFKKAYLHVLKQEGIEPEEL